MGYDHVTVSSKGNVIFHGTWGDWRRAKGHLIAQYPNLVVKGTPNKPEPTPTPQIALEVIRQTKIEISEHFAHQELLRAQNMAHVDEPIEQSETLKGYIKMLAPSDRLDVEKIVNGPYRRVAPQRVWQAVREWRAEGRSISPEIIRDAWECAEANRPASNVFTMQLLERIYMQRTFKGADQTGA